MGIAEAVRLEVVPRLDPSEVAAVGLLVEQVTETDGVRPLSEHVSLHLRYGGDSDAVHVLAWQGLASTGEAKLVGYAHMDTTDVVEGSSAELAVHPEARQQGIGRAIVAELIAATPDGRLRLWAHGEHPAAAQLAHSMGLRRSRVMHQLRRSLYAPLAEPHMPDGTSLRTFEPGRDDAEWLAVNNEAFATHPEQGKWTLAHLQQRINEPWFDAAGFFLAIDDASGRIIGFHWTKVHGGHVVHAHDDGEAHAHEDHGHEPIGEIYVIGVLPSYGGRGLGRALALVGLRHLRTSGLTEAMLFVEADNQSAMKLYESLGFTVWNTDVMFKRA